MTKKLFEEDVYLASCEAAVISKDELNYIFDQTIFFPEGGGQSADIGYINGIEVLDVQIKNDIITHTLASALDSDSVIMTLDWPKRLDQMQQHCGEHILSGIIKEDYDGNNRGFHIGASYVTIDIDTLITSDMLDAIEDKANKVIQENILLDIGLLEEGKSYPLRKEPTVDEAIRVVTIPDVDCVACCGTHPSRTGDVGLIKLYKVEKNKSMSRIYFKCGQRAVEDYKVKTDIVQHLNKIYSSDDSTLLERYEKEKEKYEAMKKKFILLNRSRIENEVNNQLTDGLIQYIIFDDLDNKEMNYVVKTVTDKRDVVVLLYSESAKKVLMSHSGKHDLMCNQYFKDIKSFNGKGGGNKKMAQGAFESSEEGRAFFNAVKEQLSHDRN